MPTTPVNNTEPVILITGAARRIGAAITCMLHSNGYRVLIHYHHSRHAAQQLCDTLNQQRENSAALLHADLGDHVALQQLGVDACAHWGRVDGVVNNASSYYPTPLGNMTLTQWDDLFASNARASLFLTQQLAGELKAKQGAVINIIDIHADIPLPNYTIYCMAKAAHQMLTKALALELAPQVRVNGVSPGAILWPADDQAPMNEHDKLNILASIPLQRLGDVNDIARTVLFLLRDAPYITGQIIAVDGGRSLTV